MRAAAILGPGNVTKSLANFQRLAGAEWTSLIEQADVAIIFGGDGTIHRQLSTLVEVDVPLLVVPCGSGNDFARALNIRHVRDSVQGWRTYEAGGNNLRTIDLGVIRPLGAKETSSNAAVQPVPHYFCCVAGVGIDTEIARRANRLPQWIRARGGYALCAPRQFVSFAPFPMKAGCNGTAGAFRPTLLAAVANATSYGGGMKIAPAAKLDDGKLDVCTVASMSPFKLFSLFPTVYFGRHLGFKEVQYEQTSHMTIETEHPLDVYADGEYVCQTPVEFTVLPQALKVIVPKGLPNRC